MLKRYLLSVPPTKFLLVKDSLKQRGKPIVDYLISNHVRRGSREIHRFNFEDSTEESGAAAFPVIEHDYALDPKGWIVNQGKDLESDMLSIEYGANAIFVLDSLAHALYYYGLKETYRILNVLINRTNVQQIISVLHVDLLEDLNAMECFDHLATLSVTLDVPLKADSNPRASYVYKKIGGKIIRETVEYALENDELVTKPAAEDGLSSSTPERKEICPENLTTFKIGLESREKQSKDGLVLPYLPKKEEEPGGKITYEFDEFDDWDEEDPDDDLDI